MATYEFGREDHDFEKAGGLADVRAVVRAKGKEFGGKYRIRRPGGDWSRAFGSTMLVANLLWHLPRLAPGDVLKFSVRAETDNPGPVFKIRKMEAVKTPTRPGSDGEITDNNPLLYYSGNPVDLSEANARVQAVALFAKEHSPHVDCSGLVFTRYVTGTTIWSQHSEFADGGNAIDLTIYKDTTYPKSGAPRMKMMRQLALAIAAEASAGRLQVDQVIFENYQWKRSDGFRRTSYGGVFHYHVHTTGFAYQTGTPVGR